jgi:hydroxymethylglutaryl-CoA reductase (NADPH)
MIGYTPVPLGIAGPVFVNAILRTRKTEIREQNTVYIPLATTEGALVASVNRGCKAIRESGGVAVEASIIGATRSPIYRTKSVKDAIKLAILLEQQKEALGVVTKTTSSHSDLIRIKAVPVGTDVYCQLYFDVGDAMGLNMATIAAHEISLFIETHFGCKTIAIAGNFDADKKPSAMHAREGRGRSVEAKLTMRNEVMQRVLKISPDKFIEVMEAKIIVGSRLADSLGSNAQAANIFAAIAIATGQDPAHTVEASFTQIHAKHRVGSEETVITAHMPSLMVGTVGGGTGLAAQNSALRLMGIAGGENGLNGLRLASYVGAAILAGELSLIASLAEGTLASSHARLARGKGAGG